MNTNFKTEEIIIQVCNHCGCDVSIGSGKFVNRVPDFNDIFTRIENNLIFPIGDYICDYCDNNSLTDNE